MPLRLRSIPAAPGKLVGASLKFERMYYLRNNFRKACAIWSPNPPLFGCVNSGVCLSACNFCEVRNMESMSSSVISDCDSAGALGVRECSGLSPLYVCLTELNELSPVWVRRWICASSLASAAGLGFGFSWLSSIRDTPTLSPRLKHTYPLRRISDCYLQSVFAVVLLLGDVCAIDGS